MGINQSPFGFSVGSLKPSAKPDPRYWTEV
jgi:hypothetical protein